MDKKVMKDMNYEISTKYIRYNRSGETLNAKGVVIHETATPGATALNSFNYFDSENRDASANYFIDDISILNTIPKNEVSWHAGPTANSMYIGIELCHFDNSNERFMEVYSRGIYLAAMLLIGLGITEVSRENIMSHHEVSIKWNETHHTDPDVYFAQYNKNIDMFRQDVQIEINRQRGDYDVMSDNTVSDWVKNSVDQVVKAGIMAGYDNGTFGGIDALTREQLCQVLINMKNKGIISF